MKRIVKTLLAGVVVLLLTTDLKAQDPHFSQFWATPLKTNPAFTGVFDGNYRFTALYRGQWSSVLKDESVPLFRTVTGSVDFRFDQGRQSAIGVGLAVLNDKAGESEFGTTQADISFSYLRAFDRERHHNVSIGFQGGVAQRTISYAGLRFGNQFDPTLGGFNDQFSNGEILGDDNFIYFDVGFGALYYWTKNDARTNVYAGVAVNHINRPNQSFFDGEDADLFMKIQANLGAQFKLGDQVDLMPSVLIMNQGPAIETSVGAFAKFFFVRNDPAGNAFYFGPWYRMVRGVENGIASEALILAAKLDYEGFTIGFSYDLNFSELTPASNSNGAYEISVAYAGRWKKGNKLVCPRF